MIAPAATTNGAEHVDIVEFLSARQDEREAAAKAAIADRSGTERWEAKGFPERDRIEWIVRDVEEKYANYGYPGYTPVAAAMSGGPRDGGGVAEHIALHDPAHVLADVKAKRAIVALHAPMEIETSDVGGDVWAGTVCYACEGGEGWPCTTLRHLAAACAYHPDYKPTWKPEQ